MKKLYVGLYDYPYISECYELNDKKFSPVEIPENDIAIINEVAYFEDSEDRMVSYYSDLSETTKQYNQIIVCQDGIFLCINLDLYRKNE